MARSSGGGVPIYTRPGGPVEYLAHGGILWGFENRDGEFLEVLTPCNETKYVRESDVDVTPQASSGGGLGIARFARATIVLDAGHGGADPGAVGPTGLQEKTANAAIVQRLRRLLTTSHDVNFQTGAVGEGSEIPAVGAVFLTRDSDAPRGGDYNPALAYRAQIANGAGADAFVAIHNNAGRTVSQDEPGSEVFYSSVVGADRLASLIHEELLLGFDGFDADWGAGRSGVRSRINAVTGKDLYGVLRLPVAPSVIVEGVYISRPDEEALLRRDDFLDAYAEAVYRGIARFLITSDSGTSVTPPESVTPGTPRKPSSCKVPTHP